MTREDDTEEALAVRLREYHRQTEAVLEIFRRKEYVFVVDARPAPEVVQEQIRKCLGLPPPLAREPSLAGEPSLAKDEQATGQGAAGA